MTLPNYSQNIMEAAQAFIDGNFNALVSLPQSELQKALAVINCHIIKKLSTQNMSYEEMKLEIEILKESIKILEGKQYDQPIRTTQSTSKTRA